MFIPFFVNAKLFVQFIHCGKYNSTTQVEVYSPCCCLIIHCIYNLSLFYVFRIFKSTSFGWLSITNNVAMSNNIFMSSYKYLSLKI